MLRLHPLPVVAQAITHRRITTISGQHAVPVVRGRGKIAATGRSVDAFRLDELIAGRLPNGVSWREWKAALMCIAAVMI